MNKARHGNAPSAQTHPTYSTNDLDSPALLVYRGAMKKALIFVVPLLLATSACGPKEAAKAPEASQTAAFQYAPRLGSKFRHVMTRAVELAVVGTPFRQLEEWAITWDVSLSAENNATLMRGELAGLELKVNGVQILRGDEVTPKKAFVEILLDSSGKVIDVRRADTITDAIVSVSRPESADVVRAAFNPEALRYHFAGLVSERTEGLMGRPANAGASWQIEAEPNAPGMATRTLRVGDVEPCGAFSCVKVARETRIAPEIVWAAAKHDVEEYVKSQGGDPTKVTLAKADIQLTDEMVVEPATMQFHGASFLEATTLTVDAPTGQLTVKSSLKRGSTYQF
jgi:hypothetical protein